MDIIRSSYSNFYKIMYSYEGKKYRKLKQLFEIAASNASYLCSVKILVS